MKLTNIVLCDVDDTLVLWDRSSLQNHPVITTVFKREEPIELVVNTKNVKTVEKLYKLGYNIVIWSHSGADWAEHVAKLIGIEKYVSAYMDKPKYYLDDADAATWMGQRIWRGF